VLFILEEEEGLVLVVGVDGGGAGFSFA